MKQIDGPSEPILSQYILENYLKIPFSANWHFIDSHHAKVVLSLLGNEDAVTKQISGLHTTLSGLKRFTNYSVTVCAFTAAGDGVRAAPVYCHTEEDGNLLTTTFISILSSFLFSSDTKT